MDGTDITANIPPKKIPKSEEKKSIQDRDVFLEVTAGAWTGADAKAELQILLPVQASQDLVPSTLSPCPQVKIPRLLFRDQDQLSITLSLLISLSKKTVLIYLKSHTMNDTCLLDTEY